MIIRDAENTDLPGILKLQQQNFRENLAPHEVASEGFVTVHHSLEILRKMNEPYPHTIAVDEEKVVGYALTMLPSVQSDIPLLSALFARLQDFSNYMVMGQVCIDKDYRRRGIFRSMYAFMEQKLQSEFDHIITEVSTLNQRSFQAHLAVGFYEHTRHEEWVVVVKDLS